MTKSLLAQLQRKRTRRTLAPVINNSFSYPLLQSAKVSAGVYDGEVLIRTLFSGEDMSVGTHSYEWDGLTDEGTPAAAGDYTVKILPSNFTAVWQGVAGNSSYQNDADKTKLQKGLDPINGMCFTETRGYRVRGYGEGSSPVGYFELSNIHEITPILPTDWPGPPETHLCDTDGITLFLGAFDPYNPNHSFVYATKISDNTKKSFSSGVAPSLVHGNESLYGNFISNMTVANSQITGLAVQKLSGTFLFIARGGLNELEVRVESTGAWVATHTITNVRNIKVDKEDKLIVISDTKTVTKYTVNEDGSLTSELTFSASDLVDPRDLDVTPDNSKVIILDGGTSQQRKYFSNTTGALLTTLDTAGGYATSSVVSNTKNYWEDLRGKKKTFVAIQHDGSYWTGDGGNYRAQKFNSSDLWIDRIQYLPRLYYSDRVRNAHHRQIVGDCLEFNINFSLEYKESWTLTNNWGYNLTSTDYDKYISLRSPIFMFGRTFALVQNSSNVNLKIVELVAGGNVRNTGVNQGNKAKFYADGTLRYMTYDGDTQQFWTRTVTGLNGSNNPILAAPVEITDVPELPVRNGGTYYNPVEITADGKIVACESTDREGYHLALYSSTGTLLGKTYKTNSPSYNGPFPSKGEYEIGNQTLSSDAGGPGDVAMVFQNIILCHYFGEFWDGSGGQVNKFIGFNSDGLYIGQFGYAQPPNQPNKPIPGMAGNAFSPYLVYEDGNLYAFHNDEGQWAGLHRWLITGWEDLQIIERQVRI